MLLIGAILIGFSVYNSKQFEKQKAYQMEQDSIAQARAMEYAKEMAAKAESEGANAELKPSKGNMHIHIRILFWKRHSMPYPSFTHWKTAR